MVLLRIDIQKIDNPGEREIKRRLDSLGSNQGKIWKGELFFAGRGAKFDSSEHVKIDILSCEHHGEIIFSSHPQTKDVRMLTDHIINYIVMYNNEFRETPNLTDKLVWLLNVKGELPSEGSVLLGTYHYDKDFNESYTPAK